MSTPRSAPHPDLPAASRLRIRWAAIGAAVAVTLGAGTIATVDAIQTSGERLTYVANDPCRLMNTRPGDNQVGPRTTPLPEGTPITVDARGAEGNCTAEQLPDDAKALQLNVTPVNASASTDITIWPEGPIPQASSVNPRPGPPVPNAVVATLAEDGTFQMQNKFGTIDMVIDVLGYFVDHNHDDRYATKTEVAALPAAFASRNPATIDFASPASTPQVVAEVALPAGDFIVSSSVNPNNNSVSTQVINCTLLLGGTTIAQTAGIGFGIVLGATGAAGERESISLTGAGTLDAAGTAQMSCVVNTSNGNYTGGTTINAIKVGTLTTS